MGSNNISPNKAKRGEIWWVQLDPTIGSEIKKTRPAVIVNLDEIVPLKIRLVVPLTGWDAKKENGSWYVTIAPTIKNGLEKKVVADIMQTRCVSEERLANKIGELTADQTQDIVAALAIITGYA